MAPANLPGGLKLHTEYRRILTPDDPRYLAFHDLTGLVRRLGGRDPLADHAALRPA